MSCASGPDRTTAGRGQLTAGKQASTASHQHQRSKGQLLCVPLLLVPRGLKKAGGDISTPMRHATCAPPNLYYPALLTLDVRGSNARGSSERHLGAELAPVPRPQLLDDAVQEERLARAYIGHKRQRYEVKGKGCCGQGQQVQGRRAPAVTGVQESEPPPTVLPPSSLWRSQTHLWFRFTNLRSLACPGSSPPSFQSGKDPSLSHAHPRPPCSTHLIPMIHALALEDPPFPKAHLHFR